MEKTKWTDEEKKTLLELVRMSREPSGQINWETISRRLPFTPKQCQVQFNNLRRRDAQVQNDAVLSRRLNHQWSRSEEIQLLQLALQYNRNWDQIRQIAFPNLTAQKIKNKYATLSRQDEMQYNVQNSPSDLQQPRRSRRQARESNPQSSANTLKATFDATYPTNNAANTDDNIIWETEQSQDKRTQETQKFVRASPKMQLPVIPPLSQIPVLTPISNALPQIQQIQAQKTALKGSEAQESPFPAFSAQTMQENGVRADFVPGNVQLQDFNLLKDLNEMSAIDSARLFILDSARQ